MSTLINRYYKAALLFGVLSFSLCLFSAHAQSLDDVLYFKNGNIIRGAILEQVPGENIKIQMKDKSILVFEMSDIDRITREGNTATNTPASVPSKKRVEAGFGLGIPYGVLGVNSEYYITPNIGASVGVGTTVVAGMGWSLGGRYHFAKPDAAFSPRVGAFYGTNAMITNEQLTVGQSFTGLTLGAGFKWMWGKSKKWGLDADVMYLATTGLDADKYRGVEQPGKIKLSLGVRYMPGR